MRLDEFDVTTNLEVWAEVIKNKKVWYIYEQHELECLNFIFSFNIVSQDPFVNDINDEYKTTSVPIFIRDSCLMFTYTCSM
jgi:hypothetical protein